VSVCAWALWTVRGHAPGRIFQFSLGMMADSISATPTRHVINAIILLTVARAGGGKGNRMWSTCLGIFILPFLISKFLNISDLKIIKSAYPHFLNWLIRYHLLNVARCLNVFIYAFQAIASVPVSYKNSFVLYGND
jgi:hypothetical protein